MKDDTFIGDRGFLPKTDPLERLPEKFVLWEQLAESLPKLLVAGKVLQTFDPIPVIDTSTLQSLEELERAMLLLSFFGHAYIWGNQTPENHLPAAIAIPWYEVAKKLHRPPILSYASYALNNWRRIDKQGPIELGNIVLLQNFLGGMDEEWFVLVHIDIEMKAAPALNHFFAAQQAVQENKRKELTQYLELFVEALEHMCHTLARMTEQCDPYIYYHRVRPYIHGWKDNPALSQGVIYQGVDAFAHKPQLFRGETGAQSSIIPSFDALLGIEHHQDPLRIYLAEMRDYMPEEHRQFLAHVEKKGAIRQYVIDHCDEAPLLRDCYNHCLNLISRFRQTHLRFAAHYIQKQSQRSLANPTDTGTGGTPFMEYLRKHKDETLGFLIEK
jgi:indoleamine 2,3-dioxygenase